MQVSCLCLFIRQLRKVVILLLGLVLRNERCTPNQNIPVYYSNLYGVFVHSKYVMSVGAEWQVTVLSTQNVTIQCSTVAVTKLNELASIELYRS